MHVIGVKQTALLEKLPAALLDSIRYKLVLLVREQIEMNILLWHLRNDNFLYGTKKKKPLLAAAKINNSIVIYIVAIKYTFRSVI